MIKTFKEALLLLPIYIKVKFINLFEYLHVIFKYYRNLAFFKIDAALLLSYLFSNPFRVSKRFLMQKGESDIYTYGETPLTTLDAIARTCNLSPSDIVIELGCGRGRTCFWLNQFVGCRVIGIDFVPAFIQKAQKVKEWFGLSGIEFRQEDLFQTDITGASVIYLYGTCFSTQEIKRLIDRFSTLPAGAKIITVSYALNEYGRNAPFTILKQFPGVFTWGTTTVTLQVRR